MTYITAILTIGMVYVASIKNGGVPDSISAIAYIVPKWVFSIWAMLVGMSLMPPLMDALSPNWRWLGFLMVVGLACVASSPYYKTESVKLHYIGAAVCFVFAQAVVSITCPLCLLLWVVYPLAFIGKMRDWWVMTAEIICMVELLLTLQ